MDIVNYKQDRSKARFRHPKCPNPGIRRGFKFLKLGRCLKKLNRKEK